MKNKKNYIYKMNTGVMNLIALIILVILFLTINSFIDVLNLSNFELALLIPLMLVWFITHELIHGVGYYITGVNPKDITYGAKLEKGVLYCLCTGKTSKKSILISLILPFLIIGIFTLILGIIFSNNILIYLSICNIAGCSGDLIMFYHFLKIKDFYYTELADGTSFSIDTNIPLSDKKLFGLRLVEVKENITNKTSNIKKVSISKLSYLIFIILICLSVFNIFLSLNNKTINENIDNSEVGIVEKGAEVTINGKSCELRISESDGVDCECCTKTQMKIIENKYYNKNDISKSFEEILDYLEELN